MGALSRSLFTLLIFHYSSFDLFGQLIAIHLHDFSSSIH